jgi:spore germination cell wall hydrolase CwlJ-like protein
VKRLFIVAALLLLMPATCGNSDITERIKPLSKKEFDCLVRNVYHEARGESLAGKIAVAAVTINRTKHPDFPDTICKVVYQPHQFSWTTNYSQTVYNRKAWKSCADAAIQAYYGDTGTAIYFHHVSVRPRWAKSKTRVAKIGAHVFYK